MPRSILIEEFRKTFRSIDSGLAAELAALSATAIDGDALCSKVHALCTEARYGKDGPSRMRIRSKPVSKLLDELVPICRYLLHARTIGRNFLVTWIDGDQPFDAKLIEQSRKHPAEWHLEATCAMHRNENLSREILETKGGAFDIKGIRRIPKSAEIVSESTGWHGTEHIDLCVEVALEAIRKKEAKAYPPNTILVVECKPPRPLVGDEIDEVLRQIETLRPSASQFAEVYCYLRDGRVGVYSILGPVARTRLVNASLLTRTTGAPMSGRSGRGPRERSVGDWLDETAARHGLWIAVVLACGGWWMVLLLF